MIARFSMLKPVQLLAFMIVFACAVSVCFAAQEPSAQVNSLTDREKIAQLQKQLFARQLTDSELTELLESLSARRQSRRNEIVNELHEKARGCQADIATYADCSRELEFRELCADIITHLDENWRKTEDGKRWLTLVDRNIQSLFAEAWGKVRVDSTDQAAVAIVLAAKPEQAWKWIEKFHTDRPIQLNSKRKKPLKRSTSAIKHDTAMDRSKFVLLRIRELAEDEFVAQKIPNCTLTPPMIATIFPIKISNSCHAFRTVGHVVQKSFASSLRSYDLSRQRFSFYPTQLRIFGFAGYSQVLYPESVTYGPFRARSYGGQSKTETKAKVSSKKKFESRVFRADARTPFVPIVTPSADYNLSYQTDHRLQSGDFPWWWENYVSEEVGKRIKFAKRQPDVPAALEISKGEPVGIAPTGKKKKGARAPDGDSPSFVLLFPQLVRTNRSDRDVAELALERVREELQNNSVQVVERKIIDQIIKERKRTETNTKLTGFDILVRLKVQGRSRIKYADLSFIDLSTGSIVETQRTAWPISEVNVPRIQAMIKEAISVVKFGRKRDAKIRLLVTKTPDDVRLRSITKKINERIKQALRDSVSVALVEHLESTSTAEESLMLLAGMSKLPGERTFEPEADATVELSYAKTPSLGKTFNAMGIQLQVTYKVPGKAPVSESINGTVSNFETGLIPSATRKIEKHLASVAKVEIRDDLKSMALRMSQAKDELNSAAGTSGVVTASAQRERALRALKLDPQSQQARYELALAQGRFLRQCRRDDSRMNAIYFEAMRNVIAIDFEFATDDQRFFPFRDAVLSMSYVGRRSPLSSEEKSEFNKRVYEVASKDMMFSSINDFSERTPERLRRHIDELKRNRKDEFSKDLLSFVAQWQRMEQETKDQIQSMGGIGNVRAQSTANRLDIKLKELRYELLRIASELQMKEQYDLLINRVLDDISDADDVNFGYLKRNVGGLRDKKRSDELDEAIKIAKATRDKNKAAKRAARKAKRKAKSRTPLIESKWTWPNLDVLADTKIASLESRPIKIVSPQRLGTISPIVRTESRLFFLANNRQKLRAGISPMRGDFIEFIQAKEIGFLHLDPQGNATGKPEFIKLPAIMKSLSIEGAAANESILVIGTKGSHPSKKGGLHIYEFATKSWRIINIDNGLPSKWVTGMHRLDNERVLCTGNSPHQPRRPHVWFVFDFKSGEVLDYSQAANAESLSKRLTGKLFATWETRGKISALSEHYRWDDLLSKRPTVSMLKGPRDTDPDTRYYQNVYSACEHSGSIFFSSRTGFHRIASDHKVVRSWTTNRADRNPLNHPFFTPNLAAPAEAPFNMPSRIFACGRLVVMLALEDKHIVAAYDPKKDCWYGPVKTKNSFSALSDGDHIWLGGSKLDRISADDLVNAAESCGRVFTSKEFSNRIAKKAESLKDLDKAKFAFGHYEFDTADELLDKVLKDDPASWEGWTLRGMINDSFARKRTTESDKAYRMAERVADLESQKYAAALLRVQMLSRSDRTDLAAKAARKLMADYPTISRREKLSLQRIANQNN